MPSRFANCTHLQPLFLPHSSSLLIPVTYLPYIYSWEAPSGFADAQASTGGWAAVVDSAVSIVSLSQSISFYFLLTFPIYIFLHVTDWKDLLP